VFESALGLGLVKRLMDLSQMQALALVQVLV
jgi:hypothetical protein